MFLKVKKKPINFMLKRVEITATIVLYNENIDELSKTIDCFLNIKVSKKLFLIDNSPIDKLKDKFNHQDIEYLFMGKNIGFGAAHNIIINKIRNFSNYHLILNPDVYFKPKIIPNLIKKIEKEDDVIMIAPKVVFPDGKHQYSCRRYPSFFELIFRRLRFYNDKVKKGNYLDKDLTIPFYPNFIQGSFLLFKTNSFVQLKGFDERYFLYMEDLDICKKIDLIGKKKMYYPNEEIIHILKKDSSKNIRLFWIHLKSSIKYFKKWS